MEGRHREPKGAAPPGRRSEGRATSPDGASKAPGGEREDTAWQAGAAASEVLGPEGGLFAMADPADLGRSTLEVLARAAWRPAEVGAAWQRFLGAMAQVGPAAISRWRGSAAAEAPGPADIAD